MGEYKSNIEKRLKSTPISEIMSRFAITTTESTTLMELAHLMMRFKISGVPIISDSEDIIGIVTATDLFTRMKKITDAIEQGVDPADSYKASVREIMTETVHSVAEDASLYDVIKLMCEKNIHTVPVTKGRDIIGVVGRRDVLNSCYSLVEVI